MKRKIPIFPYKKILILFSSFFILFSCSKNDEDAGDGGDQTQDTLPNIVELADSVNVLGSLVDALGVTDVGLIEMLSGGGPYTVFAPTNDAFGKLFSELEGFESLDDFDEDTEKELLAEILKYHVVSGAAEFSDSLSDGKELETLQGETLQIKVDVSVFVKDRTNEDAEVVSADNEASNGVVQIIDKILLPQAVLDQLFPKPTLVALVGELEELSLLEEALISADLTDALNADGPFTLFAPSNKAIQELFDILGEDYNDFDDFDNIIERQILEGILLYHVVNGNLSSDNLAPGSIPTLLSDNSIEVIASGDTFVIGDASDDNANLVTVDQEASNGTIHIIDKILIPQEAFDLLDLSGISSGKTLKELVEETEGFSFLKEALTLTGLLDTFGEEGPFTIFAPSDDALFGVLALFGEALTSLDDFDSEQEIELLRQVLTYHVFPGTLNSSDLSAMDIPTLSGDNTLEIEAVGDGFRLVDIIGFPANFLLTDIPAQNGVIHTIDRVLVPESVVDAIATEASRVLLAFLSSQENLDLEYIQCLWVHFHEYFGDALEQEFTFFLPTNQAFLDLFTALDGYDSLADFDDAADLELLATILSYHFVPNAKLTSDVLKDGQTAQTLQGEQLAVGRGNGVFILDKTENPAQVTSADAEILNGVIHIIDKVLLPEEILTALQL